MCTLAKGAWGRKAYATDAADNAQRKAGDNKLIVKRIVVSSHPTPLNHQLIVDEYATRLRTDPSEGQPPGLLNNDVVVPNPPAPDGGRRQGEVSHEIRWTLQHDDLAVRTELSASTEAVAGESDQRVGYGEIDVRVSPLSRRPSVLQLSCTAPRAAAARVYLPRRVYCRLQFPRQSAQCQGGGSDCERCAAHQGHRAVHSQGEFVASPQESDRVG